MGNFDRIENVKKYIGLYERGGSTLLRTYLEKELEKESRGLIPFTGKIPISLDGENIIDLANVNNCFFLGGAGTGKTRLTLTILTQLLLLNDPDKLKIVIVDTRVYPFLTTMSAISKAGNINRLILDDKDFETCYAHVYNSLLLLLTRRRWLKEIGELEDDLVLIFDDLLYLLRYLKVKDATKYVNLYDLIFLFVNESKELDIHIIMSAQHPQEIGSEITDNCDLVVLFRVPRLSDYEVFGYPGGTDVTYPNIMYKYTTWEKEVTVNPLIITEGQKDLLNVTIDLIETL